MLKTPIEYDQDGRLTDRCKASILSEVDAMHEPRMQAIADALEHVNEQCSLDLTWHFKLPAKV